MECKKKIGESIGLSQIKQLDCTDLTDIDCTDLTDYMNQHFSSVTKEFNCVILSRL